MPAFPAIGRPVLVAAVLFVCIVRVAFAESEGELKALWKFHLQNESNHTALAAHCDRMLAGTDASPFSAVVRGLGAWHHLKRGHTNAAVELLDAMASDSSEPLAAAGDAMRRRWLTRLDRERVRHVLQGEYRREVAYPDSLDAIRDQLAALNVPVHDRFRDPWIYRIETYSVFPKLRNQKYELMSPTLKHRSGLVQQLQHPYAYDLQLRPVRRVKSEANRMVVEFEHRYRSSDRESRVLRIPAGERDPRGSRVHFAYAGRDFFILSNGDYWQIVRPQAADTSGSDP